MSYYPMIVARSPEGDRLLVQSNDSQIQYAVVYKGDTLDKVKWEPEDFLQSAEVKNGYIPLETPEPYKVKQCKAKNLNRERILALIDILYQQTDDNHYLSIQQLQKQLQERLKDHVSIGSIDNDLKFLENQKNYNLLYEKKTRNPYLYAMPQSKFDIQELRMLVDAVASSRSITPKMTKDLIGKISSLASVHEAKKLENQLVIDKYVKTISEGLNYHIDKIHQAISEQMKITFQYQKYTPAMEKELINGGEIYCVAPFGLIWNSDYYYIVGKQDGGPEQKSFRVDRMVNVNLADTYFNRPSFSIPEFLAQSFFMYPGKVEHVEIQFVNQLINVVVDRFGKNVRHEIVNANHFKITIQAAISDGLVRWLLTWGGDAKVLKPAHLVDTMKKESRKLFEQYLD